MKYRNTQECEIIATRLGMNRILPGVSGQAVAVKGV